MSLSSNTREWMTLRSIFMELAQGFEADADGLEKEIGEMTPETQQSVIGLGAKALAEAHREASAVYRRRLEALASEAKP